MSQFAPPRPVFYTKAELAEIARLSVRSLEKLIRDGRIKVVRLGRLVRIPATEVDRLLGSAVAESVA